MWIKRQIQDKWLSNSSPLRLFPVWLLLGPRQVGKSSLLRHCKVLELTGDRNYLTLDDLQTRTRANRDPALFAKELKLPITIDEIQYAPQLLPALKVLVDNGAPPGSIWLTGSQNFSVMKHVSESLAGRVGIVNLYGLADSELPKANNPSDYYKLIWHSSFPKLHATRMEQDSANAAIGSAERELYLSSYLQTYIERDIRELLGIQKRREFELFVRACALRSGQLLNVSDLASDCSISPNTAKEWISLLEDSFLIKLVHPYHSNRTKRLVKSPKLYFLDMGLAAYLGGWANSDQLQLGAVAGAAFETHVLGQILRACTNHLLQPRIHFWRTRDGQEIDFLIETPKGIIPIEVKVGTPTPKQLPALDKIQEDNWLTGMVCSLAALGVASSFINTDWEVGCPYTVYERVVDAIGGYS
jgi:uncharacterized protein